MTGKDTSFLFFKFLHFLSLFFCCLASEIFGSYLVSSIVVLPFAVGAVWPFKALLKEAHLHARPRYPLYLLTTYPPSHSSRPEEGHLWRPQKDKAWTLFYAHVDAIEAGCRDPAGGRVMLSENSSSCGCLNITYTCTPCTLR
eukprot:TRINITY_DN10606_c1_g9_i1.p1 TRINITY_DN10606_c1_g9~~TRINITY_DN10606_c1_g9_i1.p1  ORF type:complete len:142 (+),score=4.39 TRINITY_DN10606_c1_g9_i1:48-473(+)